MKLFTSAQIRQLEGVRPTDEIQAEYISYDSLREVFSARNDVSGETKPGKGRGRMIIAPRRPPPASPPGPPCHPGARHAMMETKSCGSTLIVRGLQKSYGKKLVVRDVSLQVECGEVVGLLGPNGAGKTTSFYMIVGLVPSDAGSIDISGVDISSLPIHRRATLGLSYLPQEASVFRRMTVEDNIRAVLELQKIDGRPLSKTQINERLDTLLADLQIEKLRENQALSLSGGERRRVEIARALATNPRFVLLDEPFAGVDPIAVIEIQRIVRFLKERGIGVLITDHNVRETLGICDRAYIINQGAVLASGRPDDIIADESVRRVYLGEHFRM